MPRPSRPCTIHARAGAVQAPSALFVGGDDFPLCAGQLRLISFIKHSADIRQILDHIGVDPEPPRISPARGPTLWHDCGDAQLSEGVVIEQDWVTDRDGAAQPAPNFEAGQRIGW